MLAVEHPEAALLDPALHEVALADAERRLGRALTAGEKRIDLVKLDRDLAAGKARLVAAIETERRSAARGFARAAVAGREPRLRIRLSPSIRAALRGLYEAGRSAGRGELRRAGFDPDKLPHALAAVPVRLATIEARMHGRLHDLGIAGEHRLAVAVDLSEATQREIAAAVDRLPGVRAIAADFTSVPAFAGLGSVWDEASAAGVVTRWTYTSVLDDATCDTCAGEDGETYDSWEAIQEVLPDGGPNPDCDGGDRCRCRAVPEFGDTSSTSDGGQTGGDFLTGQAATEALDARYAEWGASLSVDEKAAIQAWRTEVGYVRINEALRAGRPVTDEIKRIDAALARAPELGNQTEVLAFRGVDDLRAALGTDARAGRIITDPGFSSVTTERGVAEDYAQSGGIIEIELPADSRGAWMRATGLEDTHGGSEYYAMGENKELLLARGQAYEIVSISRDGYFPVIRLRPVVERSASELRREADTLARDAAARAKAEESSVTSELSRVVDGLGGRLDGLKFKLKEEDSIARKIGSDAIKKEITQPYSASKIVDALRYTAVFDEASYAQGLRDTLARMEAAGFRVVRTKNYWGGDIYKGVNVVVENANGYQFEVQFHTAESLAARAEGHVLYEAYRLLDPKSAAAKKLYAQMVAVWSKIPKPPGNIIGRPP